MKREKKHMTTRPEKELSRDILSRMEIPFSRSKDESWAELQKKMASGDLQAGSDLSDSTRSGSSRSPYAPLTGSRTMSRPLLLAAASLVLLLSITAFLRYHTKTVATGAHTIAFILPDGSETLLSENSEASWNPLWWRLNREVRLDGEALFTVQKGKTFTVASSPGTTEVLGTTFRVTARPEIYKVACFEGSVKVTAAGSTVSATLSAYEQVIVQKDGRYSITLIQDKNEEAQPGEKAMPFEAFRSVPAEEVFGQIADHYGITIRAEAAGELLFSGNLQFNGDPEKLLNAVCQPLELRYEKTGDNEFVILDDKR